MFVVIAGGGRTGATLATVLLAQSHEVCVLEHRRDVLPHLHRELPTEVVVEGNPANPQVLEMAGIRRADVIAACMPDDPDNLAICFLARSRYRVPRTIATINNPRCAWLFGELFHVDVALNQAQILVSLIQEEMSLGDMMTLLKLRRGRYSLVEEKIPAGARAVGMCVKDVPLPPQAVIAAVIRRGEILIPRGALRFEEGDEVLAVVDANAAAELAALFGPPGGR
ncbi:MAG TPA: NAD-binding protein [Candidatus Polarisedimenticolaceae bacterium]|nr:NAD-binding protein [Candidatus Polarisedimenticolaceae bacterium]